MEINIFKRLFGTESKSKTKEPKADFQGNGNYTNIMTLSYSGEKNLGEMGPAIDYRLDYGMLRLRSWQSQLESDVCKTVIKRFVTWVVGEGLKLQSEPQIDVLGMEGITINKQDFSKIVEARFGLFKKSKSADYSEMSNIDIIAANAFKNAIIGGDVLVIQRFDGKNITVQLIDGSHIQSPYIGDSYFATATSNGNTILNGIEINPKGKHIAYYIRTYSPNGTFNKYERIDARSKSNGLQTAFLVYGSKHRLDNLRGLPLLAACLETAKKMERYKEAVLGLAEEVAKTVYQVTHQAYSDGSNPLGDRLAKASGFENDKVEIPNDVLGQQIANTVAATTNKQAVNMPVGAELKAVKNDTPIMFKDFYQVNTDLLCATVGIPPNVAMSKYDDSFSASRAAIKDWEHTLMVERRNFAFEFYEPIFQFWLDVEILKNKINAPGYLDARNTGNTVVLDAYRKTRWVGSQVPHIDPVKEVKAEREKLGEAAKAIPLTTVERATEVLNGGESDSNIEQFAIELAKCKELGIEIEEKGVEVNEVDKVED